MSASALEGRGLGGPGSTRVEWMGDRKRFAQVAPAWDALAPGPFQLHRWLDAFWDAFAARDDVQVAAVWHGERLMAGVPLWHTGRTWRPLANAHSVQTGPVGAPTDVDVLLRVVLARTGTLVLESVPPAAASGRGWVLRSDPWTGSPEIDTTGDVDAWRADSKGRWGAPLERFGRKMDRDHDRRLELLLVPQDVRHELDRGFAVEASGWKGEAGTAMTSTPETAAFYRSIAQRFADKGELRCNALLLDGEVAAWDLCLLHRRRLHLLKTGFDERHRRLAPGLVLRLEVIRASFASPEIDAHVLGPDATPWKLKFATSTAPLHRWRCYARRPVPLGRLVVREAVRGCRRRWRTS